MGSRVAKESGGAKSGEGTEEGDWAEPAADYQNLDTTSGDPGNGETDGQTRRRNAWNDRTSKQREQTGTSNDPTTDAATGQHRRAD